MILFLVSVPITVAPTVATPCTTSDMKITVVGTFWDGDFALKDSGAFSRDISEGYDVSDAMVYFEAGGLLTSTSTSTSTTVNGCKEGDAWFIAAYTFYYGSTSDISFNLGMKYPMYYTASCVGHPALIDTQWYEQLSADGVAFPVTVTFSCQPK